MNIFLPEITIQESIKSLDDKRLIKQILECYQIIKANQRVLSGEQKVGYANHPVVKHYRDKEQFVIEYGFYACQEYRYRFYKEHTYSPFFVEKYMGNPTHLKKYDIIYIDGDVQLPYTYIITERLLPIHIAFQTKLINKWDNDKRKPKWTNREIPIWYLRTKMVPDDELIYL